jgi:hypothetical protein
VPGETAAGFLRPQGITAPVPGELACDCVANDTTDDNSGVDDGALSALLRQGAAFGDSQLNRPEQTAL